jgi:hypothetical protein
MATHLRDLLIEHGILAPVNRDLVAFADWLSNHLPVYPPAAEKLFRGFATWHHLPRTRDLAEQGNLTRRTVYTAEQQINVAGHFLYYLDVKKIAYHHLRQAHIDSWLAAGSSTRYTAGTFDGWAGSTRRLPIVRFPNRSDRTRPIRTEPDRLRLLDLCFRPDTAPLSVRVAGILVLLYAQPITPRCVGCYRTPPLLSSCISQAAADAGGGRQDERGSTHPGTAGGAGHRARLACPGPPGRVELSNGQWRHEARAESYDGGWVYLGNGVWEDAYSASLPADTRRDPLRRCVDTLTDAVDAPRLHRAPTCRGNRTGTADPTPGWLGDRAARFMVPELNEEPRWLQLNRRSGPEHRSSRRQVARCRCSRVIR